MISRVPKSQVACKIHGWNHRHSRWTTMPCLPLDNHRQSQAQQMDNRAMLAIDNHRHIRLTAVSLYYHKHSRFTTMPCLTLDNHRQFQAQQIDNHAIG